MANQQVQVYSPQMVRGTIPAEQLDDALAQGYKRADDFVEAVHPKTGQLGVIPKDQWEDAQVQGFIEAPTSQITKSTQDTSNKAYPLGPAKTSDEKIDEYSNKMSAKHEQEYNAGIGRVVKGVKAVARIPVYAGRALDEYNAKTPEQRKQPYSPEEKAKTKQEMDSVLTGVHDIASGTFHDVAPVGIAYGAATNPVGLATTLARGAAGQYLMEKGAQKLGFDKPAQDVAGDFGAVAGAGKPGEWFQGKATEKVSSLSDAWKSKSALKMIDTEVGRLKQSIPGLTDDDVAAISPYIDKSSGQIKSLQDLHDQVTNAIGQTQTQSDAQAPLSSGRLSMGDEETSLTRVKGLIEKQLEKGDEKLTFDAPAWRRIAANSLRVGGRAVGAVEGWIRGGPIGSIAGESMVSKATDLAAKVIDKPTTLTRDQAVAQGTKTPKTDVSSYSSQRPVPLSSTGAVHGPITDPSLIRPSGQVAPEPMPSQRDTSELQMQIDPLLEVLADPAASAADKAAAQTKLAEFAPSFRNTKTPSEGETPIVGQGTVPLSSTAERTPGGAIRASMRPSAEGQAPGTQSGPEAPFSPQTASPLETFTDEGFRSRFKVPDSVSLQDLAGKGVIEQNEEGLWQFKLSPEQSTDISSATKAVTDSQAELEDLIRSSKSKTVPLSSTASMKMMITKADEAKLLSRGYTQKQINKMKPEEVGSILSGPTKKAPGYGSLKEEAKGALNAQVSSKNPEAGVLKIGKSGSKPVKQPAESGRPKEWQSIDDVHKHLSEGSKNNKKVLVEYDKSGGSDPEAEPRLMEMEPYSYRGDKFFGYDSTDKTIKGIPILNIIKVEPTDKSFKPRWATELHKTDKKTLTKALGGKKK